MNKVVATKREIPSTKPDCDHSEFFDFDCGEYTCSECSDHILVQRDGDEGRCRSCASQTKEKDEP